MPPAASAAAADTPPLDLQADCGMIRRRYFADALFR
jgi:hypothetical protein